MAPFDAPGSDSEAGRPLADIRKLPAISLVRKNVNKLAIRQGEAPSLASGDGSQVARTPVQLYDSLDTSEIPSSSPFTDDPFDSSTWTTESNQQGSLSSLQTSENHLECLTERRPLLGEMQQFGMPSGLPMKMHPFDTLPQFHSSPLQSSRQRKRAMPEEEISPLKKRARHNEVDCKSDESEGLSAGGKIQSPEVASQSGGDYSEHPSPFTSSPVWPALDATPPELHKRQQVKQVETPPIPL
ncbi:hypothetical protein JVT61DRAFT_15612 [Boletus reticuloceps]|uniref:Uncharacterized protein n=1 Tax=Boletus reticuloceps TaxID=495285 RepID=A0A8I3A2H3_9AGAM|nr:hypothetical protein JVT61DRAFT_15612 [Boletus reticuloceps]